MDGSTRSRQCQIRSSGHRFTVQPAMGGPIYELAGTEYEGPADWFDTPSNRSCRALTYIALKLTLLIIDEFGSYFPAAPAGTACLGAAARKFDSNISNSEDFILRAVDLTSFMKAAISSGVAG